MPLPLERQLEKQLTRDVSYDSLETSLKKNWSQRDMIVCPLCLTSHLRKDVNEIENDSDAVDESRTREEKTKEEKEIS